MKRKEFLVNVIGISTNEIAKRLTEIRRYENKLDVYLNSIEEEYRVNKKVVEKVDVMYGFKEMNQQKIIEDYQLYFPIYKAGHIKYGVPWFLLWLIHEQESGASVHPNPESSGYVGGMQRDTRFYKNNYVKEAADGWEMLNKLPQRYCQQNGFLTNDYEEILFAARKINEDANNLRLNNPLLGHTESLLESQMSYCNPRSAQRRIDQFKKINPIFINNYDEYKRYNQEHNRKDIV